MICTRNNPVTGRFERVHRCDSCQMVRINGVACHETGCPDAWRDCQRECKWCGTEFVPGHPNQSCCDEDCYRSYHNLPTD